MARKGKRGWRTNAIGGETRNALGRDEASNVRGARAVTTKATRVTGSLEGGFSVKDTKGELKGER